MAASTLDTPLGLDLADAGAAAGLAARGAPVAEAAGTTTEVPCRRRPTAAPRGRVETWWTATRRGGWCTAGTGAAPAAAPIAAVATVAAAILLAEIVAAAAGSPVSQETNRRTDDVMTAHTTVGRLPE